MDHLQRQGALTISRKDQIVAKACRAVLDTYEGESTISSIQPKRPKMETPC